MLERGSQVLDEIQIAKRTLMSAAPRKQVFRGEAGHVNGALLNARANCVSLQLGHQPGHVLKLLCVAGEQRDSQSAKENNFLLPTCWEALTPPGMESKDET